MKRFAIAAAIAAGLLWSAGTASAQYRGQPARSHTTMSGHNQTISGQTLTNHNHLTPQRVGVITNSSPYTAGGLTAFPNPSTAGLRQGFPSPYTGGAGLRNGNYYNPMLWSGLDSQFGLSGWSWSR